VIRKRTALTAALAVVGLALAVGVGLAANAVSKDSVGLSAKPLHAGRGLAPPEARDSAVQRRATQRRAERARLHRVAYRRQAKRARFKARAATQVPAAPAQPPVQPVTQAPPSKRGGDGGKSRGSEPDTDEDSGDHASDDDSSAPAPDEDTDDHTSDD
jgi:hypothetical protein